jgi:hypothetical protein
LFLSEKANSIFNLFVDESGDKCINIEASVRKSIKKLYESAREQPLEPSLFERAEEAILMLMEKDLFPRFLKSKEYASWKHQKEAPNEKVSGMFCCCLAFGDTYSNATKFHLSHR